MGPHDWLGVPRIGPPRAELRWLGWFVASAAVHLAILASLPDGDATAPMARPTQAAVARALPPPAPPRTDAEASDAATGAAAPGAAVAMGLTGDTGESAHASSAPRRDADVVALLGDASFAAVTGSADLGAGLDTLTRDSLPSAEPPAFGLALSDGFGSLDEPTAPMHYDTIGHGSADWSGGGGGRAPVHVAPSVRIPRKIECGGCDSSGMYRTLRHCVNVFQYCRDKALIQGDGVSREVVLTFTVLPNGLITLASVKGGAAKCLLAHLATLRMPRQDETREVTVRLVFSGG